MASGTISKPIPDTPSSSVSVSDYIEFDSTDVAFAQFSARLSGKTITIYIQFGANTTTTSTGIGTIKEAYRPGLGSLYAIAPIFARTAPYNQIGTAWLRGSTGAFYTYTSSSPAGCYCSITYAIA